jgi:hypothetical protein
MLQQQARPVIPSQGTGKLKGKFRLGREISGMNDGVDGKHGLGTSNLRKIRPRDSSQVVGECTFEGGYGKDCAILF